MTIRFELPEVKVEVRGRPVVSYYANERRRHRIAFSGVPDEVRDISPVAIGLKSVKELEPKTHHLRDSAVIVGSAAAGHVVSKKTGHNGGTLAGTATGFALVNTMKSNIVLKRGTLLRLRVNQDIVPPALAS